MAVANASSRSHLFSYYDAAVRKILRRRKKNSYGGRRNNSVMEDRVSGGSEL